MTTDPTWREHLDAAAPAAAQLDPADTFAPHDGQASDFNLHGADLLAEPDEAADPTRR